MAECRGRGRLTAKQRVRQRGGDRKRGRRARVGQMNRCGKRCGWYARRVQQAVRRARGGRRERAQRVLAPHARCSNLFCGLPEWERRHPDWQQLARRRSNLDRPAEIFFFFPEPPRWTPRFRCFDLLLANEHVAATRLRRAARARAGAAADAARTDACRRTIGTTAMFRRRGAFSVSIHLSVLAKRAQRPFGVRS